MNALIRIAAIACLTLTAFPIAGPCLYALDGGALRINPRNGWGAFELISVGDDPAGDSFSWALPSRGDGLGAWHPDSETLQIVISHENPDATISAVNLDLASFRNAIGNAIGTGNTGGVSFVQSARQAYDRWSDDSGSNWTSTDDISSTSFVDFCSAQSYIPESFGPGRGFVDNLSITGEEEGAGRLFVLDLQNRDFYQLSGTTGIAPGGVGGMPFDSFENAALVDTEETNHVALVLSSDGGTRTLKLYIGEKGKDKHGNPSNSFLARNGLAYGSYHYFNDDYPSSGTSLGGFFDTTLENALIANKQEDVDTNPNNPTQFVQGVQETGLFTFEMSLDFSSGSFSSTNSSFSITRIQDHNNDTDGLFGDADNVDWTEPTLLNGTSYEQGLIFVNEDSGTANGETWVMSPDGSGLTLIADTVDLGGATETSGILDISTHVGYLPGSILLMGNQGAQSSISVLINPDAARNADFNHDGQVNGRDFLLWQRGESPDPWSSEDLAAWQASYGFQPNILANTSVPEPASYWLILFAAATLASRMHGKVLR